MEKVEEQEEEIKQEQPKESEEEDDGDSSDDDSTSSSEAPTMKRSWTIQKKPPVAPTPPPPPVNKDDDDTVSSASLRRREMLMGYNRPEEFDPQPRSKHSRSVPSPQITRSSPRKPRGSKVSQAVNMFQATSQKERNASAISTAESIDSTKPFVVVIDPKREKPRA